MVVNVTATFHTSSESYTFIEHVDKNLFHHSLTLRNTFSFLSDVLISNFPNYV